MASTLSADGPGSAHQQRSVGSAVGNQSRSRHRDMRIGGVLIGSNSHVDDLLDPVVGAQIALQPFLVLISGLPLARISCGVAVVSAGLSR
jgi:hypothetical protein